MQIKHYYLLVLALLAGCLTQLQAQECGTDQFHQRQLQRNPGYAAKFREQQARWGAFANTSANALIVNTANGPVYEIPVVVHVMHANAALGSINNPSDATIITYIDYLNKVYSAQWGFYVDTNNGGVNVPIRFVLAKRAPSAACGGTATTGIVRVNVSATYANYAANGVNYYNSGGLEDSVLKSLSIWPTTDYYNIWMVNYIDGPSGGTGGYATYPGNPSWIDGTVILAQYATPYSNGTYYYAVPHELGHAFGLPHTFQGSSGTTCPVNSNCTTDGDGVCDTEPHINLNNGVCASGVNPCTGVAYAGVQYNLMNYTACPNRFTAGQRTKMLFNLTNYRPGLLYSLGATAPAALTTPTVACIPAIAGANAGNQYDIGPNEITLTDNTGATVFATSTGGYTSDGYKAYLDRTCTQLAAPLTLGATYTISVATFANAQNVKAWIDYNNDGTFAAGEQVLTHNGTLATETHTATFTVPATGVATGTPLRMRVISDFGTTIQPCMTLSYGQAEDYSVNVAALSPTVTIAANPGNTICAGTSVTFTATASNAPSPTYQWKRNGGNVGTNSPTYTTTALVNGDVISCSVTTGSTTVTSTGITMTVNPAVTPSVTITSSPSGAVCAGTSVTYTAVPVNGGATPGYQWSAGGANVPGATASTYTAVAGTVVGVTLTSTAACASPTTAAATVTTAVNPLLTPSVTIAASPGTSVCAGTSVTFTATPVNGGSAPSYQWKLNGVNVGANSATYTNNTLANGNIVTCVLTSNATCASPATANSNALTMTVSSSVTPSVTISANPGSTICANTAVTFTAVPVNGGTAPSYQWKLNGVNVGTNSASYTNATLANGNVVTCVLTSNASCASTTTATSNAITMSVTGTLAPAVTVAANPGTSICSGTSVTFTATPVNGGATPSYQWQLNGVNVGANSPTYTNAGLLNGNMVACILTSSFSCASPSTANSNTLTMSVAPQVAPSVSIAASPGNAVCNGTSVTFTATPVNGGTTPSYQWKVNGANVGTNSPVYTSAALANGNVVTCVLTSNATCTSTATATSNSITMSIATPVTPSVTIAANPGTTVCSGASVTFTATPVNGGAAPSYQWKLNGVNVGANSATYTNAALANGNVVTCVLTSNAACTSASTATSNVLTMTVSAPVTPIVTISANPAGAICAGTQVTFTATPVNGGATPAYLWYRNGSATTAIGSTYATSTLANGETVSVMMTSNAGCVTSATVSSNVIAMTVNTSVVPAISISAGQSTTICAGTPLTFTASIVNGGATPAYQWKVNGVNTGTNAATFTNNTWSNNDVVTATLTSSAGCPQPAQVNSNGITVQVVPMTTPAVTITASPRDTVCAGTLVLFTATPANGGTAPVYAWQKNGVNVGTAAGTYTDATLNDSDIITVIMTGNAACSSRPTAFGNIKTMRVNDLPNPVITASGNVLSTGSGYVFYQWSLNNVPVSGANGPGYTATDNGSYTVTVTDANGCSNTSAAYSYQAGVGIPHTPGAGQVTFYPNPAQHVLYIQADEPVNAAIYSMEGKLVLKADQARRMDIRQLADGVYMIQIRSRDGQLLKTGKLTKAVY